MKATLVKWKQARKFVDLTAARTQPLATQADKIQRLYDAGQTEVLKLPQVRQRLIMLHRLMNEDLSLLPLWQTMDHFAYRKTLRGLASRRLELYDDVEQWQVSPQLASSQT